MKTLGAALTLLASSLVAVSAYAEFDASNREDRLRPSDVQTGNGVVMGRLLILPSLQTYAGTDSNYLQHSGVHEMGTEERRLLYRSSIAGGLQLRWLPAAALSERSPDTGLRVTLDVTGGYHRFTETAARVEVEEGDTRSDDPSHAYGAASLKSQWSGQYTTGLYGNVLLERVREPSLLPDTNEAYARQVVAVEAGVGVPLMGLEIGYRKTKTKFLTPVFAASSNTVNAVVMHVNHQLLQGLRVLGEAAVGVRDYTDDTELQVAASFGEAQGGASLFVAERLEAVALAGYEIHRYDRGENFSGAVGLGELRYHLLDVPGRAELGLVGGRMTAVAGVERDADNSYLGNYYLQDQGYLKLNGVFGSGAIVMLRSAWSHVRRPTSYFPDGAVQFEWLSENRLSMTGYGELPVGANLSVHASARYLRNFSQSVVFSRANSPLSVDAPELKRLRILVGVNWAG